MPLPSPLRLAGLVHSSNSASLRRHSNSPSPDVASLPVNEKSNAVSSETAGGPAPFAVSGGVPSTFTVVV